ncbi:recombinase family protein, partial [Acidiphilium sp.]|uniref:recombinase family protein n=1 Tax=Acidiphilium sp. TaxID=527 RepID=UPI0038D0C1B3
GYARVSTDTQGVDPQLDELRAAGCTIIHEEHASGADRGRPVLMRLLKGIRPGETLVVVRLDRLARSVSHLLAVIEQLETAGAYFRSLRDPIDTTRGHSIGCSPDNAKRERTMNSEDSRDHSA